jgi:hypothetical protein
MPFHHFLRTLAREAPRPTLTSPPGPSPLRGGGASGRARVRMKTETIITRA